MPTVSSISLSLELPFRAVQKHERAWTISLSTNRSFAVLYCKADKTVKPYVMYGEFEMRWEKDGSR
jgi:hypothetical protein